MRAIVIQNEMEVLTARSLPIDGVPTVKTWLSEHPRFHFHFTPTGASWLNLVERFFAKITRKRLRRGTFRSVPALIAAIRTYGREHNKDPRPFIWTVSALCDLAQDQAL